MLSPESKSAFDTEVAELIASVEHQDIRCKLAQSVLADRGGDVSGNLTAADIPVTIDGQTEMLELRQHSWKDAKHEYALIVRQGNDKLKGFVLGFGSRTPIIHLTGAFVQPFDAEALNPAELQAKYQDMVEDRLFAALRAPKSRP